MNITPCAHDTPTRPEELARARDLYSDGVTISVDDDAKVSRADDGTWVQAWVWIDYDGEAEPC